MLQCDVASSILPKKIVVFQDAVKMSALQEAPFFRSLARTREKANWKLDSRPVETAQCPWLLVDLCLLFLYAWF